MIPEKKEQKKYKWRDVKCFNDLKEMLDIKTVVSYSDEFSQSEIFELLDILCKLDFRKNGEISIIEAKEELI